MGTGSSITTEAVIVATRGVTPVYEPTNGALRLTSFVRETPACADLAECPRVVDEHGDTLRALVVRSVPLAPGVHLQVRALGLIHDLSGSPVLVGVPVADNGQAPTDLEHLKPQLERLVQGEAGYGQSSWTWSDAGAAAAYIQEATARAARARSGRRVISAWQTLADTTATGASAAEAQVAKLPARFQNFVREQLDPQERISIFAHRPQSRPRRPFARATREGLFVLTDQQVLWLEDVSVIGSDLQSWGYDARTLALERVGAIERSETSHAVRLSFASDAHRDHLVVELPSSAAHVAQEVEARVRRYVDRPRPLPRRIYSSAGRSDPLVLPSGWPDAEPIARGLLEEVIKERGAAPVLAAFVIPGRMHGEARGLFALYPGELVYVPVPGERGHAETFPLWDIAWLELRRSVLTSHLRIVGAQTRTWTSASFEPVLTLVRALRPLLANAHPVHGARA